MSFRACLCFCIIFFITVNLPDVQSATVTVSGLSSGAEMATQFQVAFSSIVSGAAIFAGGPYYCARNSSVRAVLECMNQPLLVDTNYLNLLATIFEEDGLIDPLVNVKKQSLYLYSGLLDTVVIQPMVRLLQKQMQELGLTNIKADYLVPSEHCIPTNDYGNLCPVLFEPFISNCLFDGAGKALLHLYQFLKTPGTPDSSNLYMLEQQDFTPNQVDPADISMADYAYAYVPPSCEATPSKCRLHVSFHGCLQGSGFVGTTYVLHGGFNKWAHTNNIIVLYPQAKMSLYSPMNPQGCWDWWGYTDEYYATKNGKQMMTVRNMIQYFQNDYVFYNVNYKPTVM